MKPELKTYNLRKVTVKNIFIEYFLGYIFFLFINVIKSRLFYLKNLTPAFPNDIKDDINKY